MGFKGLFFYVGVGMAWDEIGRVWSDGEAWGW